MLAPELGELLPAPATQRNFRITSALLHQCNSYYWPEFRELWKARVRLEAVSNNSPKIPAKYFCIGCCMWIVLKIIRSNRF